jgi:Transglycosylase-like domain
MFGSDSGAPCCGVPPKDVIMRPKTTTALAIAATAFAPPAAFAAGANDPPSPTRAALRAPLAGHLTVASQMRAERRANIQDALTTRAVKLARREADVRDEDFHGPAKRRRLRGEAPAELREHVDFLRADIREAHEEREAAEAAQAAEAAEAVPVAGASTASPTLEAIAACESGGDPTTNTGNGFYGKYQFAQSTWQSVGGVGNPAAASEAEQDMRAAMLYEREGSSPWPVCGG